MKTFLNVVRILVSGLIDIIAIVVFFLVYDSATTDQQPAYPGQEIHRLDTDSFWASPLPYAIIGAFVLSFLIGFLLQRYTRSRGFGIGFRSLLGFLGNAVRITLAALWAFAVQMDGSAEAVLEVVFGLILTALWAAILWFYYGKVMRRRVLERFEEALQSQKQSDPPSVSRSAAGTGPEGFTLRAEGIWGKPPVQLSAWAKTEKTKYYDPDSSRSVAVSQIETTDWLVSLRAEISSHSLSGSPSGILSDKELASNLTGEGLSAWNKLSSTYSFEIIELTPEGLSLFWKPAYAFSYLGVKFPDLSEIRKLTDLVRKVTASF